MFQKLKDSLTRHSSTGPAPTGPVEYLIVGLGNPGQEYEQTRHNAGFMAVDHLAQTYGCRVDRIKYKSLCGDCMIGGKRVLLMKPSTFMNNSGEAVRDAAAFYKIPPERILVIFDDISLDVGRMRIRRKGTDGGHNGIKSIIYLTGRDDFPRIKLGIGGKPRPDYDLAAWVLSKFTREELAQLEDVNERTCAAVKLIVEGKIDDAMSRYNR